MKENRKFTKILVTGGSGFIGSNFIHNFITNNPSSKVINIDLLSYAGNEENNKNLSSKNYLHIKGDICSKDAVINIFKNYEVDAVINFAAESHVDRSINDPYIFIHSNIIGTYNLLECIKEYKEHFGKEILFHHISTDEVYGSLTMDDSSFTEAHKYYPNSPYSASKAASDHIVRAWHKTFGLPVTISNCSNNYGPFQYPEKLIPLTIYNAINGKNIELYGNGLNIRDWLYVKDHCDAIEKIIKNGEYGETYNIGGNNEINNIEIVENICKKMEDVFPCKSNSKSKFNSYFDSIKFVNDRPGHDFRYAIDSTKIKRDLGWYPNETFESGIVKTINWYIKNEKWLNSAFIKNV